MKRVKYHSILICALVIMITISPVACQRSSSWWPGSNWSPPIERGLPAAPGNLIAQADSYSQITILWTDNSDNEDGFCIYRNGTLIKSVPANATAFQDKGLRYGTVYSYSLSAYNNTGEAMSSITVQGKTLNPPVTVRLDRIGVINDHDPDPFFQGPGDIYLYLGISDGQGQPQVIRIPSSGTIKLNDNESKAVGQLVFQSNCIGDELKIVAVAFESDPAFMGILREVFIQTLASYLLGDIGGAAAFIITMLQNQPSSGEGSPAGIVGESTEDDFVGAIERTWTFRENWGIGTYSDVRSGDLRLWFTISLASGMSPAP